MLSELETKRLMKISEKCLINIGETIKGIVPFEAEMPSEKIAPPTIGDQADCNAVNTCHVDEFLYDQDEVHELVKDGKLKRHYCLDCNSRNIKVGRTIIYIIYCENISYSIVV